MRRANENKKEVYLAWRQSGKSKMAFCKERGIGYHTFVKECKWFSSQEISGFSKVEMIEPSQSKDRIEIYECDGRKVFLPVHTPLEIIRMFLKGHARAK
jgi:hypothetical protein